MEENANLTLQSQPVDTSNLNRALADLIHNLENSLESLEAMKMLLAENIHDEKRLPDIDINAKAARAIDLLHDLQLLLESPVLILADHFLGYVKAKCLSAAVQTGIPDALGQCPMTLVQLAAATDTRSDRLGQIMRMLCNHGIFAFDDSTEQYSHSAASLLLQTGHWTQWHNWVTLYGDQFYDIARGIPGSIHGDARRSAAQINYQTDDNMFQYFHKKGWAPQLHLTLGGGAAAQMPGILEDYPWHEVAHDLIVDIGGGGGAFLAGLLRNYPTMRGGIMDLAHVIDHTRHHFRNGGQYADVGERVKDEDIIVGDFFKHIPVRSVYTMKWCLHDWKDPEAVAILKNIRQSITSEPQSRLVILESVLADGHSSRLSQYGDINMMMTISGQERTKEQWHYLANLSGWKIKEIVDLRRAWVKAIDLRPI